MNEVKVQKYKMALLYSQTMELNYLYNSEKILSEPKKYFLIEKNDLNNYKKQPFYNKTSEYFKYYNNIHNYAIMKNKLFKEIESQTNNLKANNKLADLNIIKYIEQGKFNNNICLIKEEFLSDFFEDINLFKPYDVYIGNKIVIIKGNQNSALYICQLEENNNDNDFSVKVINCFYFNYENELNDKIKEIISNNKINNNLQFNNNNQIFCNQNMNKDIQNNDINEKQTIYSIKNSLNNTDDIINSINNYKDYKIINMNAQIQIIPCNIMNNINNTGGVQSNLNLNMNNNNGLNDSNFNNNFLMTQPLPDFNNNGMNMSNMNYQPSNNFYNNNIIPNNNIPNNNYMLNTNNFNNSGNFYPNYNQNYNN